MKKTLMAILATFIAATPLAAVNAQEIDYSVGKIEHNFIVNKEQEEIHKKGGKEGDSVGIFVRSLGRDTTDPTYIKGLAVGAQVWTDSIFDFTKATDKFEDSLAYGKLIAGGNKPSVTDMNTGETHQVSITAPYVKDYNTDKSNIDLMTKDQVIEWFGLTADADGRYIFNDEAKKKYQEWMPYEDILFAIGGISIDGANNQYQGIITKTVEYVSANEAYVWAIVPTHKTSSDDKAVIESVELKKINAVGNTSGGMYIMVPIYYFNETYNCKYEVQTACYECGDDYQWLEVGKQASTCKAVPSKTSKATCVKPKPTGVEDYITEFVIAAGVCGVVLLAVKRKSLFNRV